MSDTIRVPEDCATLEDAVNQVHGDNRLTTIIVGKGEHQIDGSYLHIPSTMIIKGDPNESRDDIVIHGGIYFEADDCHLEGLTVSKAKQHGVRGISYFTMVNVLVQNCGRCGIRVYGADAMCTNVEVSLCGWSGVTAAGGATITLIGDRTSVYGNCTNDLIGDDYGLQVLEGSTIQLISPLTKECASDNGGDRNWDKGVVEIEAGETKTQESEEKAEDTNTPPNVTKRRKRRGQYPPTDNIVRRETNVSSTRGGRGGFKFPRIIIVEPMNRQVIKNANAETLEKKIKIIKQRIKGTKKVNENGTPTEIEVLTLLQMVVNETFNKVINPNEDFKRYIDTVNFSYKILKMAHQAKKFKLCKKMLWSYQMRLLMFRKAVTESDVDSVLYIDKYILDADKNEMKYKIFTSALYKYYEEQNLDTNIILGCILKTFEVSLDSKTLAEIQSETNGDAQAMLKLAKTNYFELQQDYRKKQNEQKKRKFLPRRGPRLRIL